MNHDECIYAPCSTYKERETNQVLYTPYISRGFYFREFRESVLFANLSTRENIYLRSRRMHATCVRNTLLSSIANLTTRENVLKSRFAKN